MNDDTLSGATIYFRGIVQGVGFRPTVYRYARRHNLAGSVKNTDRGVVIEVEGRKEQISRFYRQIIDAPPDLAVITESSLKWRPSIGLEGFSILESEKGAGFTPVSPDIATCSDCLKEVMDPHDRRYRYPFTNCTNCGPRYTILKTIPYDRKNTTMSEYTMCGPCRREYESAADRRYHAQPNACPACGPAVRLVFFDGKTIHDDPLSDCIVLLKEGGIVAVKGLGGYHLACDPENSRAVETLRCRKKRPKKPFALMARDLETAAGIVRIDGREEDLLLSCGRPIVLLEKKPGITLSPSVAPDTNRLGVMLPYTPLHHLLLRDGPGILVMTSANLSEEPLFYKDDEAFTGLQGIADAILTHDRGIQRPCDDSVVTVVEGNAVFFRRSRGWVPGGIELKTDGPHLFSSGASEKNSFAVFRDKTAYMSQYIGDLDNAASIDAYTSGIRDLERMFRVRPEAVVCDRHPDYPSTLYAEERSKESGIPLFYVQHHHAHIASVLAERGEDGPVIGVAFDGTGYGDDGCIWGGEFLIASCATFRRWGHFDYVPMPGGERSILEIERMAVAWLCRAYGTLRQVPGFDFLTPPRRERAERYEQLLKKDINSPFTSSCGRLFDAVSAMLGLCSVPAYDAQGAILLEEEAKRVETVSEAYPFGIDDANIIRFEETIRCIAEDRRNRVPVPLSARRFHETVIRSTVEMCDRIRKSEGLKKVALSGGVFQNRLIMEGLFHRLKNRGFAVFTNRMVPPNDGGIALGQTAAALAMIHDNAGQKGGA
ncbi:MAG: carbamoyltransferase HypF [Spirochaetes bacterium]|nr:carbamoyltransferase HypF [Spirochaetota bacterium]